MALQEVKLNFNSMNVSVQVGDVAYYSYNTNNVGGFDHSKLSTTKKLGEIVGVNVVGINVAYVGPTPNLLTSVSPYNTNIIVKYDPALVGPHLIQGVLNEDPIVILNNSFISFAKEKKINTSSLLGYYADVKFVNDSTDKVELFSVGSEITESSK